MRQRVGAGKAYEEPSEASGYSCCLAPGADEGDSDVLDEG